MAMQQIRTVFLCLVLTALSLSIIFVFRVSTTTNPGKHEHHVENRGKRKFSVEKLRHDESYQDFVSESHAILDDENQESLDAENANAMANVFTNLRRMQGGHSDHSVKGFQDILSLQELNQTESFTVDQAIKRYFIREKQNLTQQTLETFVIVTTVNFKFHNLFDNWLRSIKKLGLTYNIMLICEDKGSHRYYSRRQNDHFKVLNTLDFQMLGKLQRKQGSYQQLIKRRTMYVRNLLFSGVDVLLVDIDAVWLKDPLEILRHSYTTYDIWVAQGYDPGVPCPCFLYMKAVPSIMKLAGSWMHRLADKSAKRSRKFESDQFALQHVMKWRPDLRVFSLDKIRFPTGKEFFDPEWNQMNLDYVYVAHGNHLGRETGKVDKFKEFGLWLLDD